MIGAVHSGAALDTYLRQEGVLRVGSGISNSLITFGNLGMRLEHLTHDVLQELS